MTSDHDTPPVVDLADGRRMRGSRPWPGWADELEAFRETLVDPLEHRRPDPAIERLLEERVLEHAHDFRQPMEVMRELFESGTVHHPGATSGLFADLVDQERESDQVHAMRLAVEGMVARYAAEHPGEIRP